MSQLRVVWPENWQRDSYPRPSRKPTLTEFYADYVLPMIRRPKGRASGTVEQDWIALRHWKRITGDPPLDEITAETCARFMAALAEQGLAGSTMRKTAIHLQFILDHAGPADRRHRNAADIISLVPYIERPEGTPREPEQAFTLGEIELLIESCREIKCTSAIPCHDQPLWWACLIRFAWHTGLRRMNLLNARWSWVTEDGWLVIPAAQYKQKKGGRRVYLSKAARQSADKVRFHGEDRMFAWAGTPFFFHTRWRCISAALPAGRRFCTKAIRRATLTWLAERNPLVSRLVAGHRKLDVLEDYYVQRDVIINLLESMPAPKGWDI
ncbi:MAG: hypothetical protein Kow0040_29560 [Thermogutta sp.]